MEVSRTRTVVMEGSHALAAGEGERRGRASSPLRNVGSPVADVVLTDEKGRGVLLPLPGNTRSGEGRPRAAKSRGIEGGKHRGATIRGGRDMRRR